MDKDSSQIVVCPEREASPCGACPCVSVCVCFPCQRSCCLSNLRESPARQSRPLSGGGGVTSRPGADCCPVPVGPPGPPVVTLCSCFDLKPFFVVSWTCPESHAERVLNEERTADSSAESPSVGLQSAKFHSGAKRRHLTAVKGLTLCREAVAVIFLSICCLENGQNQRDKPYLWHSSCVSMTTRVVQNSNIAKIELNSILDCHYTGVHQNVSCVKKDQSKLKRKKRTYTTPHSTQSQSIVAAQIILLVYLLHDFCLFHDYYAL